MKNIKRLLGIMVLSSMLIGCGADKQADTKTSGVASDGTIEDEDMFEPAGDFGGDSTEELAPEDFAKKTVKEYPISDDIRAKLDALDTDYAKVNWGAEYQPADGIVVSEAEFVRPYQGSENAHLLAVAVTNLTGNPAKVSLEGYVENTDGDVIYDILTEDEYSELKIWDGSTSVILLKFKYDIPSGNINWKNIKVEPWDKEFTPYELKGELRKDNYGYYKIDSQIEGWCFDTTGFVLDKDGNIIDGNEDDAVGEIDLMSKTFGGEDVQVVIFANPYK